MKVKPVAFRDRFYDIFTDLEMQPVYGNNSQMTETHRSGCPINLATEVLGDKWSIVIIRDIMFGNARHFRELLAQSDEGISSNILHSRLQRLVEVGLLKRSSDDAHKQKAIYSLTEMGIQLVPVFAALGSWGLRHLPTTETESIRSELIEQGGPALWEEMMENLRDIHLRGKSLSDLGDTSAFERLDAAYEARLKTGR